MSWRLQYNENNDTWAVYLGVMQWTTYGTYPLPTEGATDD